MTLADTPSGPPDFPAPSDPVRRGRLPRRAHVTGPCPPECPCGDPLPAGIPQATTAPPATDPARRSATFDAAVEHAGCRPSSPAPLPRYAGMVRGTGSRHSWWDR